MEKIFIVDAVNFLFRSYYAIGPMTNNKGESTSALYGFIRSLNKLKKDFDPKYLICVFDGPNNKQSRQAIYADYKMNRKKAPDDLYAQIEMAYNFCKIAKIPAISIAGVEADDTMASIGKWAEDEKFEVFLCTSDKDLFQLISKHVFVLQTFKNNLIIDEKGVFQKFGIQPNQMLDFLAIMGDKSDNIPGIAGFGPKTAATLLQEFHTLDNLLENVDKVKNEKRKSKIIENQDKAILSKRLATLDFSIKFPHEKSYFELFPGNDDEIKEFYKEMGFLTLLKDFKPTDNTLPSIKPKIEDEKTNYHLVNTKEEIEKVLNKFSLEKEIVIDTETTSLKILDAKIVGIGLTSKENEGFYIPFNGDVEEEFILPKLKELLENFNIDFIGHNIKYDYQVLLNYGIEIKNICFDTILASYLLNPQSQRHGLDKLSLEIFGKTKISIKDLIGSGKKQISMMEVPSETVSKYCSEDVDYTFRLKKYFEKELKGKNLFTLLTDLEIPLLFILAKMERKGIFIEEKYFEKISIEFTAKLEEKEKEIYKLTKEHFNINSPKQLAHVLYDKMGLTVPGGKKSTAAPILEKLAKASPLVKTILEYRTYQKLLSTYINALPKQINTKTNRIHSTFNQSVTATGRLSSQDPNLQNIPIRTEDGKKIRKGFKPEKDNWIYLSADYSQIELRLLAHFSKDPNLLEAFQKNEDIHSFTASKIFDIPVKDVTKDMRYRAKAVNFGIIYGQGPYGLSNQINISTKEASKFIDDYFRKFEKIPAFLEEMKEKVKKNKEAITLFGRKRPIAEISNSNFNIRQAAERLAVNTPLQGTAADLIKMAMIEIDKTIKHKNLKGYLILQVHDELIFELPSNEENSFKNLVKDKMENIFKLEVPLVVDIQVGKNWSEC